MVGNYPDKKEKNVRKHVLPSAAQDEIIVALFDITVFGSAKDAVVFTPRVCYVKEIDDCFSIPIISPKTVRYKFVNNIIKK